MRKLTSFLMLTAIAASSSAFAAPADTLEANRAAMGGGHWDGKLTSTTEYAYSGQGLTGKVTSRADLKAGYWVDDFVAGPLNQANGFDGTHAWLKDPSGAISQQDGGDQRQLAVNEGYRRSNMWWRSDRGGAAITDDGQKTSAGATYDVLTITPPGGKNFDAWFDAKTHLLSLIIEQQGPQLSTTTLSDYRLEDGVEVAHRAYVNTGETKYDQTFSVTSESFGPALDASAYGPPKVTVADFGITGGKETTFPFHLYNNHIYADVSVNGKGPYQFIFDTGGTNFVTPALAHELGLATQGQLQGGGAGAAHMDFGITKVASLQLGNATVKNQVFVVVPIEGMEPVEGVKMPGMVGFETFHRFVTRFDYGKGEITLIMPDAFDPRDSGEPVPFTFNGNTIEATAYINGIKGNFTIDTGSRASVTLNAPFVAANHLNEGKVIDSVNGWGVGGPTRGSATRGKTLQMGSLTINGPVTELSTDTAGAFADKALAGNIGAGILKHYVVTLDYAHQLMYLKPTSVAVADLDTYDRSGMWINQSASGFSVVDVTKGAPADQAGLKVGDEIVAVNGSAATSLKLYDLRQELRDDAPGTVVALTVKRGGETKDVRITLRDLI
jgi:hypothetical protein